VTGKKTPILIKEPQLAASTAAVNGFTVKVASAAEHPNDARRIEDAVQLLVKMHAAPNREYARKAA
jgi:hypothetical protein